MYHDRAQFSVLFIETNLAVTTKSLIYFMKFYESNAKFSSGKFQTVLQMSLLRKMRPAVESPPW